MDVARFLEELDLLFGVPSGTLDLKSVIDDVPGWNSLVFLGLIVLIDESYNITVKARQIHECVTVADLIALTPAARSGPRPPPLGA